MSAQRSGCCVARPAVLHAGLSFRLCGAASPLLPHGGTIPPYPPRARITRGQKDAGKEVPTTAPAGSCLPIGHHARAVQGRRAVRGCRASPGAVAGVGPSLRPHVIARQNRSLGERPGGGWRARWRQAWPLPITDIVSTLRGLILLALRWKGSAEAASTLPQASALLPCAGFVAGLRGWRCWSG